MSNATVHLILCLAALAALVVLIVTGHEPNALITALLGGLIGGSGGSGFAGFVSPASGTPRAQGGFASLGFLGILALLAFGIVGCSTITGQSDTQKLETACASASAAIKGVTVLESSHVLTADENEVVRRSIAVTSPVCSSEAPPTYPGVEYSAVIEAADALNKLRAKYGVAPVAVR